MASSPPQLTIGEIADAIGPSRVTSVVGAKTQVSDVHMDSRTVTPGSLYVAIRGQRADGHSFVPGAVAAGAAAVAVEEPPLEDVPHVVVVDTRDALGWMAAAVHDYPTRDLCVTGVTGTNGKTTVAHMLAAMTSGTTRETAVVGTVSANLGDIEVSPRTTPESSDLQRIMRQLVREGRVTDIALEVSSHAMVMGRVNGMDFDLVAFTNLSQDHLDFHGSMEEYYQAKAALFTPQWAPHGVVWIDDPWGRRLAAEASIPITTVGAAPGADVGIEYGRHTPAGSTFTFNSGTGGHEVNIRLAGRFNVANAALALTCAELNDLDLATAVGALAAMVPIPGRYNTEPNDLGLWVVVDYAHTPDAIAGVIDESRPLVSGRIVVVVGAGGDRDRDKRPLMGQAAAAADLAIITTDNPRSEDPAQIISEIVAGIPAGSAHEVILDRQTAIREALSAADPGDAVLILGKGHETGQEFADRVDPFDDREIVQEELDRLTRYAP